MLLVLQYAWPWQLVGKIYRDANKNMVNNMCFFCSLNYVFCATFVKVFYSDYIGSV